MPVDPYQLMGQMFGQAGPGMVNGSPGITPMNPFTYGQGGPGLGGSAEPVFMGVNRSGQQSPLAMLVDWIFQRSRVADNLNPPPDFRINRPPFTNVASNPGNMDPGGGGGHVRSSSNVAPQTQNGTSNIASQQNTPQQNANDPHAPTRTVDRRFRSLHNPQGGPGWSGSPRQWSPDFGAANGPTGNRGARQDSGAFNPRDADFPSTRGGY